MELRTRGGAGMPIASSSHESRIGPEYRMDELVGSVRVRNDLQRRAGDLLRGPTPLRVEHLPVKGVAEIPLPAQAPPAETARPMFGIVDGAHAPAGGLQCARSSCANLAELYNVPVLNASGLQGVETYRHYSSGLRTESRSAGSIERSVAAERIVGCWATEGPRTDERETPQPRKDSPSRCSRGARPCGRSPPIHFRNRNYSDARHYGAG